MPNEARQVMLAQALTAMISGALAEALGEMASELRRYAGNNFDGLLDELENKAVSSIKNAAIDTFFEEEQLFLVEKTRAIVSAKFADIRSGT